MSPARPVRHRPRSPPDSPAAHGGPVTTHPAGAANSATTINGAIFRSASFGAMSHAIHYDVLWYAAPNGSRIRPFVAVGAGIKVYRGIGTEVAFQPLSSVALLTKAQDLTPVASAGGGVKMQLSPRLSL